MISLSSFGGTSRAPSAKRRARTASVTVSAFCVAWKPVVPVNGTTATVPSPPGPADAPRLSAPAPRLPGSGSRRSRTTAGASASTVAIVPTPSSLLRSIPLSPRKPAQASRPSPVA